MGQVCGSESWKRKRLNFCGSGSTLKKEAGSGSKKYSTASTSLYITYTEHIQDSCEHNKSSGD